MRAFQELRVWKRAHELTLEVYRVTKSFPPDERFGLTSQLRRAAGSIPANIAEGCGRDSEADFRRFLTISAGSTSEVEYHLLLAKDLRYLTEPQYVPLNQGINEVKRMLNAFIQKLSH